MTEIAEVSDLLVLYVDNLNRCIEHERTEEAKRSKEKSSLNATYLEKQGLGFCNIKLASFEIGASGSIILKFAPKDDKFLPSSQIGIGDVVAVSAQARTHDFYEYNFSGSAYVDIWGCVEAMTERVVTISAEKFKPLETSFATVFFIKKLPNSVTNNRMKAGLKSMVKYPEETSYMTDILFGKKKLKQQPIPLNLLNEDYDVFVNNALNVDQKAAVKFALSQKDLAVIHGPPGTGKTTVLAELIHQLVKTGEKVLVCAPSNIAVDNIMLKVLDYKVKAVRLGHPSRLSPNILSHTVDAYINTNFPSEPLREAKMELKKMCEKVLGPCTKEERVRCNSEIAALQKEIKRRERKVTKEALLAVGCVFVTLTSAHRENMHRYFPQGFFSSVVIDECSQALDPACWMAIPYGRRCILAGDHLQLPPVILSAEAMNLGLGYTLMERITDTMAVNYVFMLTHQFRMNNEIMSWVSHEHYENRLTADHQVASQLLTDMPDVQQNEYTVSPLVLVNTSGCGLTEHCHHSSYGNMGEADIVAIIASELVHAGVSQENIAIITPYKRQVDIIKGSLKNVTIMGIEVQTVDGFQGQEKEAIILSLVRSNPDSEVGFVADRRRMNVAVSRARRFICLITDVNTVKADPTCASLVTHMKTFGNIKSGFEFATQITSAIVPTAHAAGAHDTVKSGMMHLLKTGYRSIGMALKPIVLKRGKVHCSEKENQYKSVNQISGVTVGLKKKLFSHIYDDVIKVDATQGAFLKLKPLGNDVHAQAVQECKAENTKQKDIVQFLLILTNFLEGNEKEIQFPMLFTKYQRMCIYEAAEHLELEHFSVGEGDQRYVIVRKKMSDKPICQPENISTSEKKVSTNSTSKKNRSRGRGLKVLETEDQASLPAENVDVIEEVFTSTLEGAGTASRRRSRRGKKKVLKEAEDVVDASHELLDELVKQSNICSSPNCKISVRFIGDNCLFCKQRFCFSHTLPEIHGCGNAAKQAARKAFVKPLPKPMSKEKKSALKKSLDMKLSEKSTIRQGIVRK